MKRLNIKNMVLKAVTFMSMVALMASAILFNVSPLIPVAGIASAIWLLMFGYANGWFEEDEI